MQLIEWDTLDDDSAEERIEATGSYGLATDWVILESDIRRVLELAA
jgi:hypothetical protein